MYVRPRDSTIKLYDLNLLVYDGRILIFSSKTKQTQYFNRHAVKTINNCKYIKRSGRIRVDVGDTDPYSLGYMSFQNTGYGEMTFFAFLSDPIYINDQCYEYNYFIDIWQTWIYKCKFRPDFVVDREHLSMSKKQIARDNPYDISLTEFTTPESDLPSGNQLYHWNNTISDHVSNIIDEDGAFLCERSDDMVYVLYMSPLDFSNIALPDDYDGPTPDEQWEEMYGYLGRTDCCFTHDPARNYFSLGPEFNMNGTGYQYTLFDTCINVWGFDCSNQTTANKLREWLDKLTTWGVTSSIVGFYAIPKPIIKNHTFIKTRGGNMHVNCITQVTPPELNVYSEKLYRAPYNYFEIATVTGAKEMYYEKFKGLANGTANAATINTVLDLTGTPSLKAAPVSYVCNFEYTADMDITNQIEMNNIPQAPYVTDAYIAMFSALAQSLQSENTIFNHNNIEINRGAGREAAIQKGIGGAAGIADTTEGVMKAVNNNDRVSFLDERDWENAGSHGNYAEMSGLGSVAGSTIKNAMNVGSAIRNWNESETQRTIERDLLSRSAEFLAGRTPAVFNNFKGIVPPAVTQHYSGSMNPYTLYGRYGFFNIYVLKRYLRPDVIKFFDDYFKEFGYKSMRVGTPYFVNFISGSLDPEKIPEWVDFYGQNITYFRGSGHVSGVPVSVSREFENLLQMGVTFIKGDDLP